MPILTRPTTSVSASDQDTERLLLELQFVRMDLYALDRLVSLSLVVFLSISAVAMALGVLSLVVRQ